eukprot:CAMPEP_0177658814 /NCGR_PEP_ID=MMETSP0447-20121125/17067_1 /TAXON_ID=0 /ORGANISM="Stygamoeba regulata, Strain BSH-02190019" /LENGTH=304 /DNA_ID=CAMNT_0019163557 /DNA_START=64 /DNA_END=978 /DNA_ORIENTATION=-
MLALLLQGACFAACLAALLASYLLSASLHNSVVVAVAAWHFACLCVGGGVGILTVLALPLALALAVVLPAVPAGVVWLLLAISLPLAALVVACQLGWLVVLLSEKCSSWVVETSFTAAWVSVVLKATLGVLLAAIFSLTITFFTYADSVPSASVFASVCTQLALLLLLPILAQSDSALPRRSDLSRVGFFGAVVLAFVLAVWMYLRLTPDAPTSILRVGGWLLVMALEGICWATLPASLTVSQSPFDEDSPASPRALCACSCMALMRLAAFLAGAAPIADAPGVVFLQSLAAILSFVALSVAGA